MFDEQETYQPRFQAYLNYTGKTHKREVFLGDYMAWIGRNLREFRKRNKIRAFQPLNEQQNEEFTKYLFEVKKEC